MERSSLNIFALTTAATTFLLLLAGSLVTSTGSGLAVPDWPLSFGQFFPKMEGGVFFEHSHRMIAGVVLLLSTILTIWLWKSEGKSKISILATIALGLVFIQALLGGVTVLYGLPPAISIVHATLAQTFFCIMVSIALFTSPIFLGQVHETFNVSCTCPKNKALSLISIATLALIFIQLILGASFRHGLGIHPLYAHIFNGFFVAIAGFTLFLYIVKKFKENKIIYKLGLLFLSLMVAQIVLGLAAVSPIFGIPLFLGHLRMFILTLHVGFGALLLANSLVIALLSYKNP